MWNLAFVTAQILVLLLHESEVEDVRYIIKEDTRWLDDAYIVYFFAPTFGVDGIVNDGDLPTKALLNAVGDLCQTRCLV